MQSHVNCPKCHAELAVDLEKCPKDGAELPKVGAAEVAGLEARAASLRSALEERKKSVKAEIAELEAQLKDEKKAA